MALDPTTRGNTALRGPVAGTGPVLTLLPGGWRGDEADIEAIAFMDETAEAMDELLHIELASDIPSMRVIQCAGRVAYRALLAKAEVLRLRGGDDAA